MAEALGYPFFQRALLAGLLAALACGIVGTYVVVKEFASISGGLAHAAFGGLGLGYLMGFDPMLGAVGFALLCGLGIGVAYRRLTHGLETLVMIVWSVGMALGIVFVSAVPGYAPDLTTYLFGNILFVSDEYLWLVSGLDLALVALVALFFRRFQAVVFDEEFAEIVGVPVGPTVLLLLALVSLVVVMLIRVVGVLLVIALLTIPAALARQWAGSLRPMMTVAATAGAVFIVTGLFLSYWSSTALGIDLPSGPVIVLLAALGYGVSGGLARLRGGRA